MKKDKKEKKSGSAFKWTYLLSAVFFIGLGVCTMVSPEVTTDIICIAAGVAATVYGVIRVIMYILREVRAIGENHDLSFGILAVVAGLLLLISRDTAVTALQLIVGVFLVISSVFKFEGSLDAMRLGVRGWWLSTAVSLASIALGVFLALGYGAEFAVMLVGGALCAEGVQDLLLFIFSIFSSRKMKKAAEQAELDKMAESVKNEAEKAPDFDKIYEEVVEETKMEKDLVAVPAVAETAAIETVSDAGALIDSLGTKDK